MEVIPGIYKIQMLFVHYQKILSNNPLTLRPAEDLCVRAFERRHQNNDYQINLLPIIFIIH